MIGTIETTHANGELQTTINQFETTTTLYKAVYAYVQDYMSRYDASHDFNHILRVLGLAKHILHLETSFAEQTPSKPQQNYNIQAIILAALLHDVGDKKYLAPGENAESTILSLLAQNDCDPELAALVAKIVENVSYSSEMKRPELVKQIVRETPELAIVQDADRLDAIGAVGIGRVFAFGAVKVPERGMRGSIEHFEDKLVRLEGLMKTESGRRIARERTRRLVEFRGWWEEECGLES